MNLEELLNTYGSEDDDKTKLLEQEKLFRLALSYNEDLCDAYVIYCILNLKAIKSSSADPMNIAGLLIKNSSIDDTDKKNSILMYVQNMINKSEEYCYCEDVEKLVFDIPACNEPLGYINEEIQRSFLLHEQVIESDVISTIDETLYLYSRMFNLTTFEFQEVAKSNRIRMVERIMSRVMREGDLTLFDQIRNIYNSVLDWR